MSHCGPAHPDADASTVGLAEASWLLPLDVVRETPDELAAVAADPDEVGDPVASGVARAGDGAPAPHVSTSQPEAAAAPPEG